MGFHLFFCNNKAAQTEKKKILREIKGVSCERSNALICITVTGGNSSSTLWRAIICPFVAFHMQLKWLSSTYSTVKVTCLFMIQNDFRISQKHTELQRKQEYHMLNVTNLLACEWWPNLKWFLSILYRNFYIFQIYLDWHKHNTNLQ